MYRWLPTPSYAFPAANTGIGGVTHNFSAGSYLPIIALKTSNGLSKDKIYYIKNAVVNPALGDVQIIDIADPATVIATISGRGVNWEVVERRTTTVDPIPELAGKPEPVKTSNGLFTKITPVKTSNNLFTKVDPV
jgi:hypothetical protein